MPKLSVIIPCLNAIRYLREAMNSILSQSLVDIEILPVDAGSTDGTWELLQEYARKDKRVQPMQSSMKSMGAQYNIGIQYARGDYIGFVEADDYIKPDMFELLYHQAAFNHVDYVKANFNFFIEIGEERYFLRKRIFPEGDCRYGCVFSPREQPNIILKDVNMWNGIYKSNFLKENEIKLNETSGAAFQDTDFVQQCIMKAKSAVYLEKSFYQYRRDNVFSSTYMSDGIRYMIDEWDYMEGFIQKNKDDMESFLPWYYRRVAEMYVAQYQKLPPLKEWEKNIYESVGKYLDYMNRAVKNGNISLENVGEKNWKKIELSLKDLLAFDQYMQSQKQLEDTKRRKFLDCLNHAKDIILFGCGDQGKNLYVYSSLHEISQIRAYTDNREDLWGKSIFGKKIFPPKSAIEKYPNAYYVIAIEDEKVQKMVQEQLNGLGIPMDHMGTLNFYMDMYLATTKNQ